jgi:glucose 1-dehydrogenase
MKKLSNQTAIVTGANSGIGKGIAIALAENGANVVVNWVFDEATALEVVGICENLGVKAMAIHADVCKEDQVQNMFQTAIKEFGTIDILVNNAGLQRDSRFEDMTLAQWQTVIDVNLTGQFLCAREAVREFIRRGMRPEISASLGKIICISSVHEIIPWAGHTNYAASKGAVLMMMKTMAQELGPKKIKINSICPGAIRTPINTAAWETPEAESILLELIPYKRVGDVEDIGKAAVWLASDDSEYVHGTSIYIDGGMTLYPSFASKG